MTTSNIAKIYFDRLQEAKSRIFELELELSAKKLEIAAPADEEDPETITYLLQQLGRTRESEADLRKQLEHAQVPQQHEVKVKELEVANEQTRKDAEARNGQMRQVFEVSWLSVVVVVAV